MRQHALSVNSKMFCLISFKIITVLYRLNKLKISNPADRCFFAQEGHTKVDQTQRNVRNALQTAYM